MTNFLSRKKVSKESFILRRENFVYTFRLAHFFLPKNIRIIDKKNPTNVG